MFLTRPENECGGSNGEARAHKSTRTIRSSPVNCTTKDNVRIGAKKANKGRGPKQAQWSLTRRDVAGG